MSGYDHWRSLAFGLSIAFVSASAVAEMTCTALAQDQGTWSAASTMPTGTGDSGVAALDGKIYVVGGSSFYPHIVPTSPDMGSGTWGSSVNYEYDPAADKWRQLAPMPIGLSHVGVVGLNHKLYAFGGFTSLFTPTLKTPLLYTIRRRIRGSGFHRLVRGVDRLAPPRSTEKFTSLADALMTQRRLIFTKYMTRRPISGPKSAYAACT